MHKNLDEPIGPDYYTTFSNPVECKLTGIKQFDSSKYKFGKMRQTIALPAKPQRVIGSFAVFLSYLMNQHQGHGSHRAADEMKSTETATRSVIVPLDMGQETDPGK
ncbi:hypothetical protein B0X71_16395 [Planococcus lenghuensis]|uniref:Uncharacterized protein n=1 Tax=Planococcus lenghuensis TaxID=2213202 RepID=A0A1Q2L385_9BACL|nr:hypothetical protein B0X71_16395 [Planococcus lenghuensis]